MSNEAWSAVDEYLSDLLVPAEPVLTDGLAASRAAGLPAIEVAPNQGKLLMLLAQIQGATRVLELGTLGGYSTTWLARGVGAAGRVVTLEAAPEHAEVARQNLDRADLADRVEIRVGAALTTLAAMVQAGEPPFDLIFIDADKANYPQYLEWTMRLTRPGSVIVADNVVRQGRILDAASDDENVRGARDFLARVAAEPRLSATTLQTVGVKGWDGLTIARVTG
ncbi:O-methyltransferase [Natronosporangium hydrolyticum]|uniref:O-methyltransferase n=1 Tax=Natronosporangium hydrolyticum TaxID=2811111 RepID=A0A895YBE0_9ACTN|nr:O-methyltransferase [Natronosporangium hydrolyticum]QSB15114.1 O-methyltransferase [Natronosporangium hydrolyticum]